MGRIRELAGKVIRGLRAANEEAAHPGRPPGHKVSQNPFFEPPPVARQEVPPPPVPPPAKAPTDDTPWYLKGEQGDPGWDETNPGWEPGKKWDPPQ